VCVWEKKVCAFVNQSSTRERRVGSEWVRSTSLLKAHPLQPTLCCPETRPHTLTTHYSRVSHCVPMHVHVSAPVCVHTHTHKHTHKHAHTHTHTHTCTHTHMHTQGTYMQT